MSNIGNAFNDMFSNVINFIPSLIAALLYLLLAWIIATVIKNVIVKGLGALGFEEWLQKKGLVSATEGGQTSEGFIQTLGKIAYYLVFILFLPAVFSALNMDSVASPISQMMTNILNFLPTLLVSAVLLVLGLFIAKLVGTLVRNLLANINASKYNKYVNFGQNKDAVDIPVATGWIVTTLIGLFFVVEALSVLNLEILNTIGAAIIAYLPLVLSAAIILALGFVGGNIISSVIVKSTGNRLFGEVIKYLLIIVAIFMTLDQLNFAESIVNAAFLLILGAVAVAFAISFGIGGRSFAEKQLAKFEKKVDSEDSRNE
ncbi:MAG TPA: mechanosensitive ion channel [Candidatus Salinicoccus merdavium]|nr:mechanosensitive ion channel [Candidatus Salinicoccus merdavium]